MTKPWTIYPLPSPSPANFANRLQGIDHQQQPFHDMAGQQQQMAQSSTQVPIDVFMTLHVASLNNQSRVNHHSPGPNVFAKPHWRASLNGNERGDEGKTPYLQLQHFEKAEQVLDPANYQVDNFTMFNSLEESCAWRSALRSSGTPKEDPTIPRTTWQKKACVKVLFKAFKSVFHATDNEKMVLPFREERHHNARVECMCWLLLEAIIRRTEHGPLLVAYVPDCKNGSSGMETFAQRFDQVVTSMTVQKTICKHLMDPPYMCKVIDDPPSANRRVKCNRELNKKKGEAMKAGKNAQGQISTTESSERSLTETTSTRAKKRRATDSTSDEEDLYDEEIGLSAVGSLETLLETPSYSKLGSHGRSNTGNTMYTGTSSYTHSSQYTTESSARPYIASGSSANSDAPFRTQARLNQIPHGTLPSMGPAQLTAPGYTQQLNSYSSLLDPNDLSYNFTDPPSTNSYSSMGRGSSTEFGYPQTTVPGNFGMRYPPMGQSNLAPHSFNFGSAYVPSYPASQYSNISSYVQPSSSSLSQSDFFSDEEESRRSHGQEGGENSTI